MSTVSNPETDIAGTKEFHVISVGF